jgi:hypothetical protein
VKSLYALVGMKHRGTEALVASLPQGEPLELIREQTNPHDANAVQVWARGQHVGYVRANQVLPLARRLDGMIAATDSASTFRTRLPAKLAVDGGRWPMVEVDE